ncbi:MULTISPECIES: CinA family protein [Methylotenera]|uniref:CinA family protein n=1 Tax=Methylotenera TaxID=359407 RepID=UPI00035DC035|nr:MULTISPECIES: CinA family protein [Methylotenera]
MHESALLYDQALLKQAHALASELGILLKARNIMLTLAESCTGGMVAETITSLPGSSAWFDCGLVTYSNQSKIELLKVLSQTLETYGAVSEAVAKEMALGCLSRITPDKTHTYIAGSITGIAGPDGGTAEKPVGTVCFAWSGLNLSTQTDLFTQAETKIFSGNRQQIRQQATVFMLQNLIKILG